MPTERVLRTFIAHAPTVIAMFDCDMRYIATSARWNSEYHLDSDLIGRSHYDVFPEISEDWKEVHRRALAGEVLAAEEDLFHRRDGSTQWLKWEVRPWYRAEEKIGGIVIFSEDITERRRLDRLKDEFVSTVSHELRTPLTSIYASLGLLKDQAAGNLPDPMGRLLAIAHKNSERLVRLINDVLDIEKMQSGRAVFNFGRVDVRSLVEQAIEGNRALAEGYGVRIRLEGAHAVCDVRADPDRLVQVVANLLSNALKFSPAQDEVVVSIEEATNAVRISVRDHGVGIPVDFKPHVFEIRAGRRNEHTAKRRHRPWPEHRETDRRSARWRDGLH